MSRLVGIALVIGLTAVARDPRPTPTPAAKRDAAVERLREIAREIRGRAAEADAEVEEMRRKAERITRDAEEESAKIRAEADDYVKRIEQEIREIREKGGTGSPTPAGAPTREALSATLSALVDPLQACWQAPAGQASLNPAEIETCATNRFREKIRSHLVK